MANHVSYYIQFREINDAAMARWKEMTDNLVNDQQDGEYWFGDLFVDGKAGAPTLDEVRDYSWTTDVIGPKWCYINDYDEDSMGGYAAWVPPEKGLIKVLEELEKFDPNIITTITYDDELLNFVGWYVYKGAELQDGYEDDVEDIRDEVFIKYPNLKEYWDEDTDDWVTDEDDNQSDESCKAEDEYNEVTNDLELMFDIIGEMQQRGIDSTLQELREE